LGHDVVKLLPEPDQQFDAPPPCCTETATLAMLSPEPMVDAVPVRAPLQFAPYVVPFAGFEITTPGVPTEELDQLSYIAARLQV
jgi:hypothetical protein